MGGRGASERRRAKSGRPSRDGSSSDERASGETASGRPAPGEASPFGRGPSELSAAVRLGPPPSGPAHVAFALTQIGALASIGFADRLVPLGLTPAHAGVLRAVAAEPGRSQQAIAKELGVLPSRLVALVDELEADGLVERRRNPDDRRHHALHLTTDGLARIVQIGNAAQQNAYELLGALDAKEQAALGRLLDLVAEAHELRPGVHPAFRLLGRER